MASITCKCGKVAIKYPADPIAVVECCCVECYQRNQVMAEKGNTEMPPGLEEHGKKPLTMVYLPGSFVATKGNEYLTFNKMRDDALSTHACCNECYTCVACNHPNYDGKMLTVSNDFVELKSEKPYDKTPIVRGSPFDFEESVYETLDTTIPEVWLDEESGTWAEKDGGFANIMNCVTKSLEIVQGASDEFKTFEQVRDGRKIEIFGVAKPENPAKVARAAKNKQ